MTAGDAPLTHAVYQQRSCEHWMTEARTCDPLETCVDCGAHLPTGWADRDQEQAMPRTLRMNGDDSAAMNTWLTTHGLNPAHIVEDDLDVVKRDTGGATITYREIRRDEQGEPLRNGHEVVRGEPVDVDTDDAPPFEVRAGIRWTPLPGTPHLAYYEPPPGAGLTSCEHDGERTPVIITATSTTSTYAGQAHLCGLCQRVVPESQPLTRKESP